MVKSKVLNPYLADDQDLRQFLKEIENERDSSSSKLLLPTIEMKMPVVASELLRIYQRRIHLISDSQSTNKFSISILIKFCEDAPDALIKTLTITSKKASYHIYFHVSDQFIIPVCAIIGKSIPNELGN